jgi:YesN/AraC family two-component response regulator
MAMKAGCDEFITKPVKKDFLIKKLEDFGIYKS